MAEKTARDGNLLYGLDENPPLARALFHTVEINQIIPAELFQAVAEVLAFVYKQKRMAF